MFGISNKKWVSIIFLLATIFISLALIGIPYLVSNKSANIRLENFEGWEIPSKGDNAGTLLSSPDVFPVQGNTETVSMSTSTPVMPGIAIAGDFKAQLIEAAKFEATGNRKKQPTVFDNVFSLYEPENFTI
jgi:hypothetical protein